jgi:hypothetical protein
MDSTRLRECCEVIGWPLRQLARTLNRHGWLISETTVRQGWACGKVPIPDDVAQWLETLVDFHQETPPPKRNYGKYLGVEGQKT